MATLFINRRLKSNRGSVLMWAVVMSLCTILVGSAYLLLANTFNKVYSLDLGRVRNIYVNYTALTQVRLAYEGTTPGSTTMPTEWSDYYSSSETGIGVRLNNEQSQGLASWSDYILWGIGRTSCDNGNFVWRDSISYTYGVETFADYLWLTNDEHEYTTGDSILWWTPDTLDGRVHSNGYLFIHGSQNRPLFLKQVTTCKPDTKPPRSTYSANLVFKGGFVPSVGRIVFPDQADSVRAYSYGDWLIGRPDSANMRMYYIRFFNGDQFRVLAKPRSSAFTFDTSMSTPGVGWNAVPLRDLPLTSQAIFVYGKLFIDAPRTTREDLQGLDGRVTIAASDSIIVLHNLMYACSNVNTGKVPLTCNDALGLISEKFLLMSKNCGAPLYPAPGALMVNAGLVALHGSMGCESVGTAPEFNSLVIHGSIAQLNRGVVHRGSAGFGTGFVQKDYYYDQRFTKSPPPHFVPSGNMRQFYLEE